MRMIFRGLGAIQSPFKLEVNEVGVRLNSVRVMPDNVSTSFDPTGGDPYPSNWIVISRSSHASYNSAVIDVDNLIWANILSSSASVSDGANQVANVPGIIDDVIGRRTESSSVYIHFGSVTSVIELDYDGVALNETERAQLTSQAFV